MRHSGAESSRCKALRLVTIYRLLQGGPLTRRQIAEALGDLYGPNPDRALRRDLETLAGRPFAELGNPPESAERHAVPLHHDRATDLVSLQTRGVALRLEGPEWAALDLVARAFSSGAPHAAEVHALLERVRAAAEPAQVFAFPVDVSLASADPVPASADLLSRIEQALRYRQEVTFRYRPPGRSEERLFEGVELLEAAFRHGHHYLTIYEPEHNRFRDVRVDRIVAGSWRRLPRVAGSAPRLSGVMVRYRLSPELASSGVSERLSEQRVEWEADGSAVVTGRGRDLFWASRLILGYGSHAEALTPEGLRAMVAEEAGRMAELYDRGRGR